jgi:flagellar export protein FliJ
VAKAFQFKLRALKKYREQRLLSAKKDLALVESRCQELKNSIQNIFDEDHKTLGESAAMLETNLSTVLMNSDFLEINLKRKKQATEALRLAEGERNKHQEWVSHLAKELKAVEKLEEKQFKRYLAELSLQEKRAMDAWVAERWTHNANSSGASI